MSSIITVCCLLLVVSIAAILNVFSYPISKKLCYKISTGIVKYCAPLVFAILSVYKNFKFKTILKKIYWSPGETDKGLIHNY